MYTRFSIHLSLLLITLILGLTIGCAPTIEIESNMRPDYSADLHRIFVVLKSRQLDENTQTLVGSGTEFSDGKIDTLCFSSYFLDQLTLSLEAVDVDMEAHLLTGLELSPREITDPAEQFEADAILGIEESWFSILHDKDLFFDNSRVTDIDLDATIRENIDDEDIAWRAFLSIESGHGGLPEMARELANTLVNKLVEDGLITPPPPDNS